MGEEPTQEEMDRQDIEDARNALAEDGTYVPLREFMHELGDLKAIARSLFQIQTGSVVLVCSNIDLTKRWFIRIFDCKQVEVPKYWDDRLPFDVALEVRKSLGFGWRGARSG